MKNADKIKVNVKIDGQIYTLLVTPDKEELVRRAARWADDRINEIKRTYSLERDADAPVMVLLRVLTEKMAYERECNRWQKEVSDKTEEILKEFE